MPFSGWRRRHVFEDATHDPAVRFHAVLTAPHAGLRAVYGLCLLPSGGAGLYSTCQPDRGGPVSTIAGSPVD
ncbi:MAG: hypothetical protein B7X76_06365 [Azorhizobium sp. 39-67-5]|nr:MAG: hypothetical protein B7X76_06365 [Azorhizobium sp. 39-67-5]